MSDAINVDTAGRNIGCHKNSRVARTEPVEGALTGALGLVTMDCVGRDAAFTELLSDAVGTVFGSREHDYPR